jgi:hypothetical protein
MIMVTKARKAAFRSYPIAMLAEKLQLAAMRMDTDEIAGINAELARRKTIGASNRPGDMAAEYAAENGVSYERALVACNMD